MFPPSVRTQRYSVRVPKQREHDADEIVLRIRPTLGAELITLQRFIGEHSGAGHLVRNRLRRGAQTLFCTCGLPSVALKEEDLFESGE